MENQSYRLSDNEISFIKDEVRKSEISFSHLEDELIDHLCCMVEDMVNDGYTFDAAFKVVRKDVGMDTLKTIEIQTLILINKKFQAMKKTLKISGIIGLSAIIIASVMKISHWPGASIILMLGFVTLLFAYLPALSLSLRKEMVLKQKMHLSYMGIFTASVLLLSFLFTFMHWPYGNYLTFLSWVFMLFFLIMLFNHIMKVDDNRVLNLSMLLFFTILFVIDVTFALLPLNNPRLSKFTIENNIDAGIKLYAYKADKACQLMNADSTLKSEMTEVCIKTNTVVGKIEQIRDAMFVNKTEQENFCRHFFKKFVITPEIESDAMKLENVLTEYREFMLKKTGQTELIYFIGTSIQFGPYDFNNDPQILYNNLQKLIRDIKIAECEVFDEMQAKCILKK